jgi:Nucleotidyltransferase domain
MERRHRAVKNVPENPYPELRPVLETFVAAVQTSLGRNFVGAYLVGSLATGDFDCDSDVDFLIVTNDDLTRREVRSLRAAHIRIHGHGCYPAEHLEGSYITLTTEVHRSNVRFTTINGTYGGFCVSVGSLFADPSRKR